MSGNRLPITVIVLTFNEEIHIERCLASVADLVEHMIVVDSFSTDRTVEIAKRLGAEIHQRAFTNQAEQFQWALDNCAIRTEWTLKLDADEYFEEPLKSEIRERLPGLPPEITGVDLKRRIIFRGRWIRHGAYYPAIFLRLWRTGVGRIEQRCMDEHPVLTHGARVTFANDFPDHNLKDITWWTEKQNGFATRQMVDFINLAHGLFPRDDAATTGPSKRLRYKRFLRNSVFGRAPRYWRSVFYFLYRYVLRLGFLDGRPGFVFHFLQGCWKWVLVDAKIEDAEAFIRAHGVEAFREHLRTHHKIDVGTLPAERTI
jgi:glycosyltransferase involved in cell wall biosynthesis